MTEASGCVLIVDGDPDLAASVCHWLKREGMRVRVAATGEQGFDCALDAEDPPVLILLDLTLPGMSGLELCRRLRGEPLASRTPVIVVTASSSESDVVAGLDAGADDYVTKPFSMRELTARVRTVMRRAGRSFDAKPYRDARLTIDFSAMQVTLDGGPVRLARMEFEVLAELGRSAGRVLTREYLIEKVWGREHTGDTKTLGVHVMRLRRKLGCAGDRIETVVGVGYRFVGFGAEAEPSARARAAGA